MKAMANPRSGRTRRFAVAVVCFGLGVTLGCSRQERAHPAEATGQTLPFHSSAELESVAAHPEAVPAAPITTTPFNGEPQAGVVPAGALLTVQLRGALSVATAHIGDSFLAIVADPLIIDGKMLIDSGTPVSGRVESARTESDQSTQLGYLRLVLSSMDMKGKKLSLETASLFARAPASDGLARSASVRLRKGHRLTFRLTAPLVLNEQYKMASAAPLGQ